MIGNVMWFVIIRPALNEHAPYKRGVAAQKMVYAKIIQNRLGTLFLSRFILA